MKLFADAVTESPTQSHKFLGNPKPACALVNTTCSVLTFALPMITCEMRMDL